MAWVSVNDWIEANTQENIDYEDGFQVLVVFNERGEQATPYLDVNHGAEC